MSPVDARDAHGALLTRVVEVDPDTHLAVPARFRALLEEALAGVPCRLVVDLGRCASLDATALGVLLDAHRSARRRQRELVLRDVPPRVQRLLALTGVSGVFAQEAVAG